MEFDFKKDYFSGKVTAKLSMGHEAFGTWLEEEGQEKNWVQQLLIVADKLQQREVNEYKLVGNEFCLYLSLEEVKIVNHSLFDSDPDSTLESANDLNFYDQEIEAECGLEDFINLLESWLAFI